MTSDKLFSGSKVTVVNFWFTTCKPCVGELGDLEALNKELASKGGQVVGVNSFTLDGDATAISEAKDILAKKGVMYKNVWFASSSEAGKFTSELFSYPTTYVVDKNGSIVGDPIVGAITSPSSRKRSASSSTRQSRTARDKLKSKRYGKAPALRTTGAFLRLARHTIRANL